MKKLTEDRSSTITTEQIKGLTAVVSETIAMNFIAVKVSI